MVDTFTLGGDPSAIRTSASQWSGFATAASGSSSDIRGLDSSEFSGDEAETFRGKVNDDLPPHLDTTSEAWGIVATALNTYATKLESYQQQMAQLKVQYDNQQQTLQTADSNLTDARADDLTEQQRVTTARLSLKPGETLPASTYVSRTSDAQTAYNEASQNVTDTVNAANQLRSDHKEAVTACCNEINRAKGMRFTEPPGWFDKLKNGVCDWIAEHADVLKKISGVLKVISAVAGLLSFIPVLAPIMGPIALVTGAAALAIDVGVKLATGEGSWLEIGIDAATMLLPGVGKIAGKALKGAAPNLVRAMNRGGMKAINAVKGSKAGKGFNALKNTKFGKVAITGPGKALNGVNSAVERGLSKVPGVNRFMSAAARRAERGYVKVRTRPASSAKQAQMDAYKARLKADGNYRTPGTKAAADRYQRKFSDTEYNLKENGGNFTKDSQFADGLNSRNAAIEETKLKFKNESPSQRNLADGETKPGYWDGQRQRATEQMQAYGDRLAESTNPMDKIVYHVAQPSQVDYYLDIAADVGVAENVVVVHSPW